MKLKITTEIPQNSRAKEIKNAVSGNLLKVLTREDKQLFDIELSINIKIDGVENSYKDIYIETQCQNLIQAVSAIEKEIIINKETEEEENIIWF